MPFAFCILFLKIFFFSFGLVIGTGFITIGLFLSNP